MQVLLLLASVVPALLILWYFHVSDRHPEPSRVVWTSFLLGMLCLLPAATVEAGISALGSGITGVWAKGSFEAFFGAALPEELAKFLVLYFYCRRRSEFDEPMDGLVYGSAVGLGFAVLENAAYVFALDGGFAVAVVRAITAVPSHGAIGAIMGYCIALSGFAPKNRNRYLLLALVVPIVLHGLYDTVVLVVGALPAGSPTIVLLGVAFLFLIAMEFYFVKRLVDEHVDRQEAQVLSRDFASYIQVRVAGARREGWMFIAIGVCVLGLAIRGPMPDDSIELRTMGCALGLVLLKNGWVRLQD